METEDGDCGLFARDESIQNYVKATIHLNDHTSNVCGLVSSDLNVFVVAIGNTTPVSYVPVCGSQIHTGSTTCVLYVNG